MDNLQRVCLRNGIANPSHMTQQEAEIGELACLKKLKDLEAEGPQRRLEYLQSCLDKAGMQQDKRKEAAIVRILKREYNQKRYRRLKVAFGQKRGHLSSRLAVRRPGYKEKIILTDPQ